MDHKDIPQWLRWAREIQALSQTGSFYSKNEFDVSRYDRLSEIAAEILSQYTNLPVPELVGNFLCTRIHRDPHPR